jgi:Fe2+ or Zn2+ uptake regulation protein
MNSSHDLKSAGLKATLPRIKIINLFETSKVRHLTAEDVYKQLLSEGLDIGLATVYRVLTQFEQAGLLVRHHFESGKSVFELNEGKHHDHLVGRTRSRTSAASRSASMRFIFTRTARRCVVRTRRACRHRTIV